MLKKLFITCFVAFLLIDQVGSAIYLYPDQLDKLERYPIYYLQTLLVYSGSVLALLIGLTGPKNYEQRKGLFLKGLIYGALFFIPLYALTAVFPGWEKHNFPTTIAFEPTSRVFSTFVFFGFLFPSFLPDKKILFNSHLKKLLVCIAVYLIFYPVVHAFFRYLFVAIWGSPMGMPYAAPPIWNFNAPSLLISVGIIVTYFFGALGAMGYLLVHLFISFAQYHFKYYVPEHTLNVALVSLGVILYFFKYDAVKFKTL